MYKNQKLGVTLVIIIASTFLAETVKPRGNTGSKFYRNLSNWFSKRSLLLLADKHMIFPPRGTKLTLDPTIEVPVIDSNMFGIGSTLRMSLPLTVIFDKLSFMDTIFGDRNGYWKLMSLSELHNLNRHKRSLLGPITRLDSNNTSGSGCNRLASERIAIFKKLETLFDSYGLGMSKNKGKSCLLRAICEIHEYPMVEGYGVLGEFITFLFSVRRFSTSCDRDSSILQDYIKAELQGRKGLCEKYYGICNNSLFVWRQSVPEK